LAISPAVAAISSEPADLVVGSDVADLDGEVARGHLLGGDGELGGGTRDPARQKPVHRHEHDGEQGEEHAGDHRQRQSRRAIWDRERARRLVREQTPAPAVRTRGHRALGARVEHRRQLVGLTAARHTAGQVVAEHERVGAEDDPVGAVDDVDADAVAGLVERRHERGRVEGEGEHAKPGAAVLHHRGHGHQRVAERRVVHGTGGREAVLPCRLPPALVALHEVGGAARRDGVEAVTFGD
jgi:hypothetical protein